MTKISILFAALICWSVPSQAVVIHSVCASGCDYPDPAAAEAALATIVPTWPILNDTYIFEWQAGQSFSPAGGLELAAPNNSQAYFASKETSGSANLILPQITDPVTGVTVTSGMLVSGPGVGSGVTVSSVSGSGPYTVTLSSAPTPPSPLCTLGVGAQTCTQTVALHFGSVHWIVHRSNECYSLPPGQRAGPVNTTTTVGGTYPTQPGMATLLSPVYGQPPALTVNSVGVSYYRFECLEIADDTTSSKEPYFVVALFYQPNGAPGAAEHQVSDLVHHIAFDRDYIHHYVDSNGGAPTYNALASDSAYMEITNSTLMVFHTSQEDHAYSSTTSRGPLYLRNNEFESSQIGTIFGGGTSGVGGMKATGVQFLGNYYYTPWLWRVTSGTSNPQNTFYYLAGQTCMYDSQGGESYINSTTGHWWSCVSGTWMDEGVGSPPTPYCQTASCTAGGATNLVCTLMAGSTTATCLDTTGLSAGWTIFGALYSGSIASVNSSTSITLSSAPSVSYTQSFSFSTNPPPLGGNIVSPYCPAGCSIDKNKWECKDCFGVVVDGNQLQNAWQPAMLGQLGQCVLFNQAVNGYEPDTVEDYITFTNNKCDSDAVGFIAALVEPPYSWQNRRLTVRNNLLTNIGMPEITGSAVGAGMLTYLAPTYANAAFDHNTFLMPDPLGGVGLGGYTCSVGGASATMGSSTITATAGVTWQNVNASPFMVGQQVQMAGIPGGTTVTSVSGSFPTYTLGLSAAATANESNVSALFRQTSPSNTFSIGFMSWTDNVFNMGYQGWADPCDSLGANQYVLALDQGTSNFGSDVVITPYTMCSPLGGSGNCGQVQWGSAPCNGCSYPTSFSSVFQSYPTNLAVASTYQGTGYLGTDPGADINVVNWSTQGAVSGAPNSYLDFRVRSLAVGATTATYHYTAPDTGACTLSVANNSGYNSPAYNSSDSGGNPDRSVIVTGLSPNTRYWYKLICGASNYRRSDVFITSGL